jgi:phospholipid/cholesterol/gamma-HCH transport system substrate-binding protein
MRRIAATLAVALAAVALLAVGGKGVEGGTYEVRAYFDNGAFIVAGEDVRIAGADVGSVSSVDVSMPGEVASLEDGGRAIPGKAVIVIQIDDPAFKDFRRDASCLIRPQSLIGERYIDCQPTQPRAAGSDPPPPLQVIPDGEPGAGQHLLPLENNGRTVDLDLIQNIMRLPYAERFRLIINDLGAGLAGRGEDLAEVVRRADPALRQADRVLAVLAAQNRALAQLASDSDAILQPLARQRRHLTGFLAGAGETAAATAERGADLEAGIARLPSFLRELRLTMRDLGGFATQATPVVSELGEAGPALSRATRELVPFSSAATTALVSLGDAAEESGPPLRAADPIVRQLGATARASAPPVTNLARLTRSLRRTEGIERLMDFIYSSSGSLNGFDQFGHFMRANFLATNCVDYAAAPLTGCGANFTGAAVAASASRQPSPAELIRRLGSPEPARKNAGDRATGGVSPARDLLDFLLGP